MIIKLPLFLAALVLLGGIALPSNQAEAAGFNCAKARSVDEKAVCKDARLSKLDALLNRRFQERKVSDPDTEDLVHRMRNFLADRKDCRGGGPCILATYIAALWEISGDRDADLGGVSAIMISKGKPASSAVPTAIGHCAATEVDLVHSRLEGHDPEFEMGIGVDYANGGYGVSYSREEPVSRSKTGDSVIMCLIEIGRDCRPDSGGRVFLTTNMRTRGSWILPDAQHQCGN
jgi:uncharacterized protein